MSLTTALTAIESDEESERQRAIPALVATESPEALMALERVANADGNLQLRFLAKEGAHKLRQRLSGTGQQMQVSSEGKLDVKHLKSRLSDADSKRRIRGVRSALASKDPAAIKYLNQLIAVEKDPKVVVELCMTIGVLGTKGDGEGLLARLRDPEPEIRGAAIRGLTFLHDRSVYPTLVAMLQDKHRHVRSRAFEALTKLGKPRLIRLLVRMLGSSRDWPRKAAIRACARINSPECAEVLVKARSQDPSPRIRREATKALVHLARKGNAVATATIAKEPPVELDKPLPSTVGLVIDRADQGAQGAAESSAAEAEIARLQAEVARANAVAEAERARAEALASGSEPVIPAPAMPGYGSSSSSVSGNLPLPPLEILNLDDDDDPDASELDDLELSTAEVMLGGLNDPAPEVRMQHLKEILAQRDRSLAPQLAARLPLETEEKVLAKLILAIGKLGRKKDARRLLKYLDHNDKRIRANSVEALSQLGDETSLRQVIPLLEDICNRVRANAVVALKDLEDADVVSVLKQMAKHPELDMRLSAVFAALEIGTTDIDVVLHFLLKDKEQEVKDKALSALNLLEDQRIAPLRGGPSMEDSHARMEKLSAWRGGAIDDEDDDEDEVSSSQSNSKSMDEEAQKLIDKLSGDDPSLASAEAAGSNDKAKGWGRMPKSTIPKRDGDEAETGFAGMWAQFMEYLTNPTPAAGAAKKKPAAGGDEDLDRRNVIIVLGLTMLVFGVGYLLLAGLDGGSGAIDDEF